MSTREQYRGMSIRSIARPLKDGSGWISEILVAEEIGSDTSESRFVLKPKFAAEQIAHGSEWRRVGGSSMTRFGG